MALSWAIAGGGTGGHVTPALALGEGIAERGDRVVFLGSDRGLETRLVPQAGFELVALRSRQVMGRGILGRALGALGILGAVGQARRALRDHGVQIVVSVGGYAAMPAVIAAVLARVPVALVEPNALPGRVNRLSARFARIVFVGFEEAASHLSIDAERVRCHGIPLRRGMIERVWSPEPRDAPTAPFHLLVFGGSQGARQINDAVMDALPRLDGDRLEIFHQAGENDRERVTEAHAKAGLGSEVVAFEPDMPSRYRIADVALCRAGALTCAELCLAGLPSLLVPYPFAADDHQAANARALERAGAARCLASSDREPLTGERVAEALDALFADPAQLAQMSAAARSLARPDAARRIIEDCAAFIEETKD